MPTPHIRRALTADADALAPLYREFYAEDAIVVPHDTVRKNLTAMLEDNRAAIWLVEEQGAIAAFAAATLTLGVEFGWAAEIEDLFVRPNHRGDGLAKALLQTAVDWAMESGATEVILVITPEAEADQGLIGFYGKLGFRKSDRIIMYKSGSQ